MSDPPLSVIDFKNKMAWVLTSLKINQLSVNSQKINPRKNQKFKWNKYRMYFLNSVKQFKGRVSTYLFLYPLNVQHLGNFLKKSWFFLIFWSLQTINDIWRRRNWEAVVMSIRCCFESVWQTPSRFLSNKSNPTKVQNLTDFLFFSYWRAIFRFTRKTDFILFASWNSANLRCIKIFRLPIISDDVIAISGL